MEDSSNDGTVFKLFRVKKPPSGKEEEVQNV